MYVLFQKRQNMILLRNTIVLYHKTAALFQTTHVGGGDVESIVGIGLHISHGHVRENFSAHVSGVRAVDEEILKLLNELLKARVWQ